VVLVCVNAPLMVQCLVTELLLVRVLALLLLLQMTHMAPSSFAVSRGRSVAVHLGEKARVVSVLSPNFEPRKICSPLADSGRDFERTLFPNAPYLRESRLAILTCANPI